MPRLYRVTSARGRIIHGLDVVLQFVIPIGPAVSLNVARSFAYLSLKNPVGVIHRLSSLNSECL